MEELLGLGDAAGGERRGLGLLVDDVVGVDVGGLLLFIVQMCIRDRPSCLTHEETVPSSIVRPNWGIKTS